MIPLTFIAYQTQWLHRSLHLWWNTIEHVDNRAFTLFHLYWQSMQLQIFVHLTCSIDFMRLLLLWGWWINLIDKAVLVIIIRVSMVHYSACLAWLPIWHMRLFRHHCNQGLTLATFYGARSAWFGRVVAVNTMTGLWLDHCLFFLQWLGRGWQFESSHLGQITFNLCFRWWFLLNLYHGRWSFQCGLFVTSLGVFLSSDLFDRLDTRLRQFFQALRRADILDLRWLVLMAKGLTVLLLEGVSQRSRHNYGGRLRGDYHRFNLLFLIICICLRFGSERSSCDRRCFELWRPPIQSWYFCFQLLWGLI